MAKREAREKGKGDARGIGIPACCRVDALVPMDGRGQIVLPKPLRDKAGLKAGDRFAVISMESGGKVCCIALVKADEFAGSVRDLLGPIING